MHASRSGPAVLRSSCSAICRCALECASLRTCWRHRRMCKHCVMHMTCCWSASTVRLIHHEHDINIVFYQVWLAIQQSQRAPPPPQQPAARPSRARNLTYCMVSLCRPCVSPTLILGLCAAPPSCRECRETAEAGRHAPRRLRRLHSRKFCR